MREAWWVNFGNRVFGPAAVALGILGVAFGDSRRAGGRRRLAYLGGRSS
jgi:hypothetical protein